MKNFRDLIKNKIVFFDGAMGTELQRRIANIGTIPELLNITSPETIKDIHRQYSLAGADIATANTFGANGYKLKNSSYSVNELITAGIKLARESSSGLVALDVGTIGVLIDNDTNYDFNKAYEIYKEQIVSGYNAGCDLVIIETMTDIYEAKAAILAAKENTKLPVVCSMTLQDDGRTLTGSNIETIINVLESLHVDAIGLNCSFGPEEMMKYIEYFAKHCTSNIIIQPNAGLPVTENGKTIYKLSPDNYASLMSRINKLGINILGGCCGTTPAHINAMKNAMADLKPVLRNVQKLTKVSSSIKTVTLGRHITVIGEKINPTANAFLRESLKNNNLEYVVEIAKMQEKSGADILDINVGLPDINETQIMGKIIKLLNKSSVLPLQVDSSKPEVIEMFLRLYNGRPIVNSVNGIQKEMNSIFPLVSKYGACVIGLTIDENGIPKNAEERFDIAQKIIKEAAKYNIPKEDIIIDCLALTASAQQEEIFETLKAVKLITDKLTVHTTLGISNVSHGLPNRDLLNSVFLVSAINHGLDTPILDPGSESIMNSIRAYRVLINEDKEASEYIKYTSGALNPVSKMSLAENFTLKDAIVESMESMSKTKLETILTDTNSLDIISKHISPALETIGQKYKSGEIFLPQLIHSAEIVNELFKMIKAKSQKKNSSKTLSNKIILATVEGDVHDIGKNIVRMLLENYNFEVYDLGKDVHHDKIIETAKKEKIDLIGLSALMTTTVSNMEKAILHIKKSLPYTKIMVGGAVLSKDYAQKINADYYGKDAMEAVAIAKKHFNT